MSDTFQGAGGVGGLLLVEAGPACYVPAYDHRSNVVGYLDAADGSSAASFAYGPFGETLRETGPKADELTYRFSTKPTDPTTKFIHYELRTYDPTAGRWLSRDPIEERGGLNLYGFVGNDPVKKWDYLGLECQSFLFFGHSSEADEQLATDFINNASERVSITLSGNRNLSACDSYGVVSCFANILNPRLPRGYQLLSPSDVNPILEGLRVRNRTSKYTDLFADFEYAKNSDGSYKYYDVGDTVTDYFGFRPENEDESKRWFTNIHKPVGTGGNLLYPENMLRGVRIAVERAIEKGKEACSDCGCSRGRTRLDGSVGYREYRISLEFSPDAASVLREQQFGNGFGRFIPSDNIINLSLSCEDLENGKGINDINWSTRVFR